MYVTSFHFRTLVSVPAFNRRRFFKKNFQDISPIIWT